MGIEDDILKIKEIIKSDNLRFAKALDDIKLILERMIVIENMLLQVLNKAPIDRQDKEKRIKDTLVG